MSKLQAVYNRSTGKIHRRIKKYDENPDMKIFFLYFYHDGCIINKNQHSMKTVLTFFFVMIFSHMLVAQPTYFGQNYTHANSSANCSGDYTILNTLEIGNNASDMLIFNHVWGLQDGTHEAYMPNSNGLWYTGSEWSIFDETWAEMDTNLAFNVLNPKQNGTSFVHTVSSANVVFNWSLIDHPLLNGHPEAVFFISKSWGNSVYELAHVGIWYSQSASKWSIYNEDGTTALELNSTYNIFIPDAGTTYFKHSAVSTNYITELDDPLLNGNPDARIFIVHDYTNADETAGYINDETGVWYDNSINRWTIYTETLPNLFLGATFNVLIVANYPTGITDKNSSRLQLCLSPNPASEKVSISLVSEQKSTISEVTITGMDGKVVIGKIFTDNLQNQCQIDVSGIQPGLYLLCVQSKYGPVTKKLNIVH